MGGERYGLETRDKVDKAAESDGIRLFVESISKRPENQRDAGERGQGNGRRAYQDPSCELGRAQINLEELEALRALHPDEKITAYENGLAVQTTAAERRRVLEAAVIQHFEAAIAAADTIDIMKAATLLSRVDLALHGRRQELERLTRHGDIFAFAPGKSTAKANLLHEDPLDRLTYAELQLLKYRLEQAVASPYSCRIEYAAYLSEKGDLIKARDQLSVAGLLGGSAHHAFAPLAESVEHRLRRAELAGGKDPLELARLAHNRLFSRNLAGSADLYRRAQQAADSLDQNAVSSRLEDVRRQLGQSDLAQEKRVALERDRQCLEELSHAPAAVRLGMVNLAAAEARFGEVKRLVEETIKLDPAFAGEHGSEMLDMLVFAQSKGVSNSVFEFHNHLVDFQKALSPKSFNLEKARRELDAADVSVASLPFDTIKQFKKSQLEKLEELRRSLPDEHDGQRQAQLASEIAGLETAIEGLDLLEHASAHTKLMRGVFELANKDHAKALSIFEVVEREDPDYASRSQTQIEELKKIARQPVSLPEERSWLKSMLKELACSAAAIAAGALVVCATGWSGPAALAAGFGAGAAVRTGMKALMGEEIRWYDPVIGGVDGLGGAAGALARSAALNGLSNSTRALTATERALQATGANAAALEGLTGTQRILKAEMLASEGLKEMGARLPWYTRMASRLPLVGNAEYRAALQAYGRLASLHGRYRLMADVAGAATASALHRGRQMVPGLISGQYDSFGDFAGDYAWSVAVDGFTGGVVGRMASPFMPRPFGWSNLHTMFYGAPSLREMQPYQLRLEEVDLLLAEIQKPSNPEQIRQWYFELPGPKVDPSPRK